MKSKAPLALMEQLIMVAVFALAAAVCVQAFTLSGRISRGIAAKDRAVIEAQTAAEVCKAGKVSAYLSARDGSVNGNAGFVVGFDKDWNAVCVTGMDGSGVNSTMAYKLEFHYTEPVGLSAYLWAGEVNVFRVSDNTVLYTLAIEGQNEEAAS